MGALAACLRRVCGAIIDFVSDLYRTAAWSTQSDAEFFGSVTGQPRFVVLGSSPSGEAAVVNELLGCAVLPTVAAEG